MITGEIKNKIDQIWNTFFVAGITNPITVLEQMTYIFFMKLLDDKQLQEEENVDQSCHTLIMANPPFAGSLDKGNVNKKILAYANTSKTEGEYLKVYSELYKMLEGK